MSVQPHWQSLSTSDGGWLIPMALYSQNAVTSANAISVLVTIRIKIWRDAA
jgi:hypothetical protein